MPMVRLRWNEKAKSDFRKSQAYRTRRLLPSDAPADEILCAESDARTYRDLGFVEEVDVDELAKRGPGRPKKTESQSQSQPAAVSKPEDEPYLSRPVLLSVAKRRGIELPPGYNTREELADIVGAVSPEELVEAGG